MPYLAIHATEIFRIRTQHSWHCPLRISATVSVVSSLGNLVLHYLRTFVEPRFRDLTQLCIPHHTITTPYSSPNYPAWLTADGSRVNVNVDAPPSATPV